MRKNGVRKKCEKKGVGNGEKKGEEKGTEKSELFANQPDQRADGGLVALVVSPLANTPNFDQTRALQGGQVVGHGGLRQPDAS